MSSGDIAMAKARAAEIQDPGAGKRGSLHARAVALELAWLDQAIEARIRAFSSGTDVALPPPPKLPAGSALDQLVQTASLDAEARLILVLALASQIAPAALDPFLLRNSTIDRPFTEFGGSTDPKIAGFRPSGETALFLVAGGNLQARLQAQHVMAPEHALRAGGVLQLGATETGASPFTGALSVDPAEAALMMTGHRPKPDLAPGFPAQRLTTPLAWDGLVLPAEVADQIEHVAAWLEHETQILDGWGLRRALAPGYRALFHGPPGTGKTLTAALLGKRAGLDVYRVDLSMIVSKYIGETEKNLAAVFDQAAHRHWILFFDEADALFAARSSAGTANDRYANQEVAYLLQRIEACPSLVILATNLRSNLDDAFTRRLQSLVGFARPNPEERLRLWRGAAGGMPLAEDVSLDGLAAEHALVGGAIVNALRHAAISARRDGQDAVRQGDLLAGIAAELRKEGRML